MNIRNNEINIENRLILIVNFKLITTKNIKYTKDKSCYLFTSNFLTLCISLIFVTCLPNSHKSTPNFNAQFFTLQYNKNNHLSRDTILLKFLIYLFFDSSKKNSSKECFDRWMIFFHHFLRFKKDKDK